MFALIILASCSTQVEIGAADVRPTLEDRRADGSLFTPSTQSMLREHHRLDEVERLVVYSDDADLGAVELFDGSGAPLVSVNNLPLQQLVPRLHYTAASPPDEWDAFNLMLAEYSRNGLSMAYGEADQTNTHFQTPLDDTIPWFAEEDYALQPNPDYRPVRFSVINNCLHPGLWELSAKDRAGEVYHAWFDFPLSTYAELVGRTNGVPAEFAGEAVQWRTEPVEARLERLRTPQRSIEGASVSLGEVSRAGYSSQGSRRKLNKGFAMVGAEGELRRPETWMDMLEETAWLVDFVPPGKYDSNKRREFDLRFLATPEEVIVREVEPHTRYDVGTASKDYTYLELELDLGERSIVIGNLPLELLTPREDYVLHGFGVGVLAAGGLAERRAILLEGGPQPSFAYLLEPDGERLMALNSHEYGIEQVFIRTHAFADDPWWEITITSFERIVDLVKYRVDIPDELVDPLQDAARGYISPGWLTYRDDNLR